MNETPLSVRRLERLRLLAAGVLGATLVLLGDALLNALDVWIDVEKRANVRLLANATIRLALGLFIVVVCSRVLRKGVSPGVASIGVLLALIFALALLN